MSDVIGREPTTRAGQPLPEEVGPDTGRLREYARSKHALARHIRALRSFAAEAKNDRVAGEAQQLMSKLAEDRFTLAVVGQFKRGKSSLMNAIIGQDILPTGVLPLTSAITILKYGSVNRLTIVREQESLFPEQPPLDALAAYVTEEGNPGNQKRVKAAVLELPIPFLRRGLEFVDTPGIGSAIVANTETTYAFLPQCDAVIFVTSVDSPLTEPELDFLGCVRQFAQKVFFVINKTDLLQEAARREVIAFISDRLRAETGGDALKIYPLSASRAMAATSASDATAYASSGLNEIEEALGAFLASERAGAFLASIAAQSLRLAEELGPATPSESLAMRLARIRNALRMPQQPAPATTPEPGAAKLAAAVAISEADNAAGGTTFKWPQALRTRGCAVCTRMADAAFTFYARWQHTLIADESAQDSFTAAMGFCSLHTWQFLAISSPLGLSAGYAKLTEKCAQKLSQMAVAPDAAAGRLEVFSPGSRQCPACSRLRDAEAGSIHSLATFLKDPVGLRLYHDSQGVCVRHLAQLLSALRIPELGRRLLQHAARRFAEEAEDMQNFAVKHDGIRRWLQNDDEKDAYLRAIIHLVGERAVSAPWHEDAEI